MIEVWIICEGDTEEQFIKKVVAPQFKVRQVFLKPMQMETSKGHRGGAVTIDRLRGNAKNLLRQHPKAVLSTFIDLYKLDNDFPAYNEAQTLSDVHAKVACLQTALHQVIVAEVGCRPERFLPHIQPYEFEALLFSDVQALCWVDPGWKGQVAALNKIRADSVSPEHINDGFNTAPSRRLLKLLSEPKYDKVFHGPQAVEKITLEVIERECKHFKSWMDKLRKLGNP